jgi:hypothetical protein
MKVPGIETARVAKNLTFSVAEYQDRLSRVPAQMAERRLNVLILTTPENIHYRRTGVRATSSRSSRARPGCYGRT